jgi:O-antigen/teichoic acid export membrane protein
MSLARKILYNVIVNSGAKVLSTALALVSIGFITRALGPEGFGEYTTALAFFALFMALADLGLNAVGAREISRKGADASVIMGNVFGIRLVISGCITLLAPLGFLFLPYSPELKLAIALALSAFFFSSSYTVLNGVFQKHLAMDRVALTELVGKVFQTGIIVAAAMLDWGLLAIMGAFVFFMLFNFIVLFFWSQKFIPFSIHFDIAFWKTFLRQSLPLGGAVIITFLYFKFNPILLSLFQGSEAVGIFGAAFKVIENITFFPAMIVGLALPLLSARIYTDDEGFRKIADSTLRVFFLLTVPLVIGGVLLAKDIILLIGGEEFLESVLVLQILLFALAGMFFGHFFNTLLIVANKQKLLLYLLAACAVVNIALNILLIPTYSYVGAAIASTVTETLIVILTGIAVHKTIGYTIQPDRFGRILFSGILMALVILLLSPYTTFFITLLLAILVYAMSIIFTKAVEKHEWQELFIKKSSSPPLVE